MGVNRFMSPVKTQYMQTAVDQHVPLPFELMQKRAEAEQKHFDDNRANMQALTDRMGEDLLNIDNPAQSNAISDLRGRLDSAIDDYNGDWRKMDDVLRNVANQYNTEVTTGKLALGKSNKIKHDTNYKEIEESNVSDWNKDLQHRWTTAGYGGILEGKEINVLPAGHKNEKTVDRILKSFNETVASSEGKGGVGYRYGDGLIVEWHKDVSGVTRDQYRNNVAGIVATDEDWQGLKKKEFRMLSDLGELPTGIENIDQYKALALEREFMGMAEGKENIQTDYTEKGKEGAGAAARAKTMENISLGITKNEDGVTYHGGHQYKDFDGTNGVKFLNKEAQSRAESFVNKAYDHLALSDKSDAATAAITIGQKIKDLGFDLNPTNAEDRSLILEGVGTGVIPITALGYTAGTPAAKVAMASVRQHQNAERDKVNLYQDILDDLSANKKLSPERHKVISDHYMKVNDATEAYNEARLNPNTSAEELSKLKENKEATTKEANNSDPMFMYIPMSGQPMNIEVDPNKPASKESALFTTALNNRLQHNKTSRPKVIHGDKIIDTGKPNADKAANKNIQNIITKNISHFLNQKITTVDHPDGKTVDELIREQVRQNLSLEVKKNPDAAQKAEEAAYKSKIEQITTSNKLFGSVLSDEGEVILKLGDFNVPLSYNTINIDGLQDAISPQTMNNMRLKTLRSKLMSSEGNSASLGKGITLTAADRDAKSNSKKQYTGGELAIQLDNEEYGLNGNSPYTVIPSDLIPKFMELDSRLNRLGSPDDVRKEAVTEFVRKYGF